MAKIDMPHQPLSDYERALCYHTLPKFANPLTFGLVVVYAVCVLEALGGVAYGLIADNAFVARVGAFAFAGIVVFGVLAFMIRALTAEIRMRKTLALARRLPEHEARGFVDIPDPFAAHLLIRHPLHRHGDLFPCTDNEGSLVYFIESAPGGVWWKVKDPHDKEVLRVRLLAGPGSFSLGTSALPRKLGVYVGDDEVARIRRPFSFTMPTVFIDCLRPEVLRLRLREGGIYRDGRLVGRVYYFHESVYLDMEEAEFNEGILGLFATMA